MTKVSSAEDYAVYQIDFGSSLEPKKSGKNHFFADFFKIFSEKQSNVELRWVFKLILGIEFRNYDCIIIIGIKMTPKSKN